VSRLTSGGDMNGWRAALRSCFRSHWSQVAAFELTTGSEPSDVAVLALRTAATELRAAVDGAQVVLTAPRERLASMFDRDLAAYVDAIAAPRQDAAARGLQSTEAVAPSRNVGVTGLELRPTADEAADTFAR